MSEFIKAGGKQIRRSKVVYTDQTPSVDGKFYLTVYFSADFKLTLNGTEAQEFLTEWSKTPASEVDVAMSAMDNLLEMMGINQPKASSDSDADDSKN